MFPGDVIRIGFPDHNAPKMSQIETFCRGVDEWLAAHVDNVAAVHCKAGKVSLGVLLCVVPPTVALDIAL
jgi:phosphatidylinositol-3,4,5-trisphosphate 3-phosphatase/dual-specificity protein phosphatase PTEN